VLKDGRRLFGTDGIRGVANAALTPEFALSLGRAAGEMLRHGPVLVGRDTRRSGEMLSAAIQAGFHSVGIDTSDVGVMPSGGIAHLTATSGAMMGIVISASHNPAPDNGIKFLDEAGFKLSDDHEDRIEQRLRAGGPWKLPIGDLVGTRLSNPAAIDKYVDFLVGSSGYSMRGINAVLDCANGAAYKVAPAVFRRLKCDIEVFADHPDGTNINDGVGATHPEFLAGHANGRIGLCFDGDADRLIAIDEDGLPANGDVVLAIIARHLKERGKLTSNVVVSTVMANLGFHKAMQRLGIEVVTARVGDRYVLEAMKETGAILGGEQSGHVIFLDTLPTGDGILTAVRLSEVVASTGRELRELRAEVITEYPQILRNVRVADSGALNDCEALWAAVEHVEDRLGDEGRVLVRASGTEPLVRVMVEAATRDDALAMADELATVARNEMG